MAYRFTTRDVSMTEGVRRVAAEEFALIRRCLADKSFPVAVKVHEGRKATKRLRALLRLMAPVFPEARNEIAVLRAAARQLSALRDKGAMSETLHRLQLAPEINERIERAMAQARGTGPAAQKRLLAAFRDEMEAAAGRAEGWTLEKEGWKALAPGLERCQRRFRKAMVAARAAETDEPVHEFRKRAKDYWYQTLLLRSAFRDVMDGYAAAGERLGDDLGNWRDLGLLEEVVRNVPAHLLAKTEAADTLVSIAKARRRALRRAFRTAKRLAWETPDAQTARLKAWWSVSH